MGNLRRIKKSLMQNQGKGYKVPVLHTVKEGQPPRIIGKKSILYLLKFTGKTSEQEKEQDSKESKSGSEKS